MNAVHEVAAAMAVPPETRSVANFVAGPGIQKLDLKFDLARMQAELADLLGVAGWQGEGFKAIPLTRRPGVEVPTANDLSGRYTLRVDDTYEEVAREDIVDESAFSEFVPDFAGSYFEEIHRDLSARFPIGRMRILCKDILTCNSWHRDPEPRLHIPVHTNPGSLFIVNHHCTHLPADGSVYFTDTRSYHTALNGGEGQRVHIVAALAFPPNKD
jgi:hypothetical protein